MNAKVYGAGFSNAGTHRFAAFESERPLLSELVVQVVDGDAECGRGVVKHNMQIRSELRNIQRLGLPDCRGRKRKKSKVGFGFI